MEGDGARGWREGPGGLGDGGGRNAAAEVAKVEAVGHGSHRNEAASAPRHSAAYWNGFTIVFGGEDQNGFKNTDVWQLWGNNTDGGRYWRWLSLAITDDPVHGRPSARTRHTAVVVGDSMIVFGGRDATGPQNDLWLLKVTNTTGQWKKVTAQGTPPSARFGHVAVAARADRAQPVMMVYGGLTGTNPDVYAEASAWELTIARAGTGGASEFVWQQVPSSTAAGQREGHSATVPIVGFGNPRTHRMVVFGGRKPGDVLDSDVWELRQVETTTSLSEWSWTALDISGTKPSARMRHAAAYDGEFLRMVVFGGDTTTTSPGGYSRTVWELPLTVANPTWTAVRADSMPDARWGHTMLFDTRPVLAHVPEVYDHGAGSKGDWSQYPSGPKHLPFYPFMFALRDGKVFFAGNGPEHLVPPKDDSWIYINAGAQSRWEEPKDSEFVGGSAAMVAAIAIGEPDTVLKCGGDDDITTQTNQEARTGRANVVDGVASWTQQ